MTDNTMVKRKRRNQWGIVKPYIEYRMTDNTVVNRKRRNKRGNLKPYIE